MWQILGLICDIAGGILLFLSTEIMNKIVMNLIGYISNSMGRKTGIYTSVMKVITKDKKLANQLSRWGIGLIIVGFIFQLITAIQQYK